MVLHKNRYVDPWNQIKNPDINTHTYGHLFFYLIKKPEIDSRKKKRASSTSGAGQTGWLQIQTDPHLSLCTKFSPNMGAINLLASDSLES